MKRFVGALCARPLVAFAFAIGLLCGGCAHKAPPTDGYRPGVLPGTSEAEVIRLVGNPAQRQPFALHAISAEVYTYPFGQVLMRNGAVLSVIVASDPSFVGPAGITLGMQEDQVRKNLRADHRHRTGHRDSYDLVVGQTDTRTRDLYDLTDHVIIEMAASNPNDPEAPFSVISITLANADGMSVMSTITQAKVSGDYPDQHVDNFVSDPWHT